MRAKATVVVAGVCALLFGCNAEPGAGSDDTQEIVDNLVQAGFPADDIQVAGGLVYTGNDAEVSLTASREMLLGAGASEEQYRTTNLIRAGTHTICVDGAAFAGTFSTGLINALANYNALFSAGQIRLRFVRVPPAGACTFTVRAVIQAGLVGGSAGFPTGGAPCSQITIGGGLSTFSVDVIEHVVTHELGHCIGLRHSDFFNRSISCGGVAVNEGVAGVGAIHIPGTPTTMFVGGSLMNSCFRSTETGEFTATDIVALDTIY